MRIEASFEQLRLRAERSLLEASRACCDRLQTKEIGFEDLSFAAGATGLAFSLCELQKCGSPDIGRIIAKRLLTAVAGLARQGLQLPKGLFVGDSGYLLALESLASIDKEVEAVFQSMRINFAKARCPEIYERISGPVSISDYDVISGVAGDIFVLAISQTLSSFDQVGIRARLASMIQSAGNVIESQISCWDPSSSPPLTEKYGIPYVNLGMAHGVFGLISAYASLFRNTKDSLTEAREVLEKGRALLELHGSAAAIDHTGEPAKPKESICTWCYGELARYYSLLFLSERISIKSLDLIDAVRTLLHDELLEHRLNQYSQQNAYGLCHGMSGELLMVKLLRELAPSCVPCDSLKKIEDRLLTEASLEGSALYRFHDLDKQSEEDYSLLNGLAGTLLALTYTGNNRSLVSVPFSGRRVL